MLQPRLSWFRPYEKCRCLHTLSRHLRAAEPRQIDNTIATNDSVGKPTRSGKKLDVEKNIGLRTYKPRTPGLRHLKRPINDHLYKGRPYMALTIARKGQHLGGRNSHTGKISVRHRGGGAKRRIRIVDFHRLEPGRHYVERIEHDPGRSAHIALISRIEDDKKHFSYIVAPDGMRAGEEVESFLAGVPDRIVKELGGTLDAGMLAAKTALRGNCLPLKMIPPGTVVFNVGLQPGGKAQLCRSAGTYATIVSQHPIRPGKARFMDVKLKSGEVRRILEDCCATIGVASNPNYYRWSLGKAGRKRWLGIRPTVRGVAMNASDHAHGGGRGKSKGNRHPVSIWGQLTKSGYKTRSPRKVNKFVVTARPRPQDRRLLKTKKKKDD